MRIVVVNNFFPPRTGGSSHLSEALARGYAAAGHQVLVVTAAYQDAPATQERDGLRIVRFPAVTIPESRLAVSFDISFATRPGMFARLRRLLDDFRPDVIHQHGQFFDLTWATARYARLRAVPVLLSVHTRLENPTALYSHGLRGLDIMLVARRLRRYRPRIVVMDALMDEYIRARYAGGYSGLEHLPVAVDPDWTTGGDGRSVRRRLGIEGVPLILSIGHVIPLRDRVALVEALPAVLRAHPAAKLVVVGRVYYDRFVRRAKELGVAEAVLSVGAVAKTEIPDFLAAADVESHEQGIGMGTATLEAMASATPVVVPGRADNFPGIALVDGGNVFLCPVGDSHALAQRLIRVLDDKNAAATVARAGSQLVREHFSMAAVVAGHLRVLEALSAGDRRERDQLPR